MIARPTTPTVRTFIVLNAAGKPVDSTPNLSAAIGAMQNPPKPGWSVVRDDGALMAGMPKKRGRG